MFDTPFAAPSALFRPRQWAEVWASEAAADFRTGTLRLIEVSLKRGVGSCLYEWIPPAGIVAHRYRSARSAVLAGGESVLRYQPRAFWAAPTTEPAAHRTDRPWSSTCSSRRSATSATATATGRTIDADYFSAAACNGHRPAYRIRGRHLAIAAWTLKARFPQPREPSFGASCRASTVGATSAEGGHCQCRTNRTSHRHR